MKRKKKKERFIIPSLSVSAYASEGKCVARHEELVVFVEKAVPGDIADVEIHKKKSSYAEGKAVNIISPSVHRVTPLCEHFGTCGGCKWQDLAYEKQIEYKQQQVVETLKRIGKVELPPVSPIIGSEEKYYYRNKLEYTFTNRRWITVDEVAAGGDIKDPKALGFHVPGMFDKVLDINTCHLQPDLSNDIRLAVKHFCLEHNYDFYDIRPQEGYMRNLIIRNTLNDQWMVIVVFKTDDYPTRHALLDFLQRKFPQITSLNYVINPKKNDTISDLEVINFSGIPYLIEEMEDLKFRVGPKSFYQTNSRQAYILYKLTRQLAGLTGNEIVYDLYTGTGTIANFVARNAKKVIGIEYIEDAVKDAFENSRINNIDNTFFLSGDMKEVFTSALFHEHGHPDVVITDPPRAGMHEDVVKKILEASPEKVVYVSCNPATQARDLEMMKEQYDVRAVQPVDMFPHTFHVENIVLLVKKK